MANKERGEIDLAFGEERYTLRFSLNAVAEIETYLDLGINDLSAMMRNKNDFRVSRWRVLLWGALREFHPCSIEDAGEIMGRAGIALVVDRLGEALLLAFPQAEAGGKQNPRIASRVAGNTSSTTGSSRASRKPRSGRRPSGK